MNVEFEDGMPHILEQLKKPPQLHFAERQSFNSVTKKGKGKKEGQNRKLKSTTE